MIRCFKIHIPDIFQQCQQNNNDSDCPLCLYLNKPDSVFTLFEQNEKRTKELVFKTRDWLKLRNAIDEMYTICEKCKKNTQQR